MFDVPWNVPVPVIEKGQLMSPFVAVPVIANGIALSPWVAFSVPVSLTPSPQSAEKSPLNWLPD
jgi:hypothetical protein